MQDREGTTTSENTTSVGHVRPNEVDLRLTGNRMTSGGVLRILQLRWRIALLCTAVGIAAATLYLRTATRVYTSTAMIHVEQNTPSVVLDGMDHSARFDNYLYTQAELLKTTPILGEVIKQPGVRDCPTLASATDPVPVLRGLLDCSVGRKNDIISLSLSSPDSKDAADLLNHVVQSYLDYHSRNTRNTASEILRILKEARQAESVELAEAMARILAFRRANGVLFLDSEKGNIIIQRLGMLGRADAGRTRTHCGPGVLRVDDGVAKRSFEDSRPGPLSRSEHDRFHAGAGGPGRDTQQCRGATRELAAKARSSSSGGAGSRR